MIGSIRGTLLSKESGNFLIEVGGLGYEVQVPTKNSYNLPKKGCELYMLTHFIVREDGQSLFGFFEDAERDLFRKLIKISGVGPKLALTILSGLDLEGFSLCVVDGDISSLVAIPGVGKKTAERLIVEMRDKLPEKFASRANLAGTKDLASDFSDAVEDAEKALESLGYRHSDARKMVATVVNQDQSLGREEIIKKALRAISKT